MNPTEILVEAVRALTDLERFTALYEDREDGALALRFALTSALEAWEAAQPSEETHVRRRFAYVESTLYKDEWGVGGTDGDDDASLAKRAARTVREPYSVQFVTAWLPRPTPPQEIETEVES